MSNCIDPFLKVFYFIFSDLGSFDQSSYLLNVLTSSTSFQIYPELMGCVGCFIFYYYYYFNSTVVSQIKIIVFCLL